MDMKVERRIEEGENNKVEIKEYIKWNKINIHQLYQRWKKKGEKTGN
jgi:hypothetical protein